MRKFSFALLLILFASLPSFAQNTQVTGTITDPAALPYAGATLKAQLVLAGAGVNGQPVVTVNNAAQCAAAGQGSAPCKVPFQGTNGPITLDSTGSIPTGGLSLQDNSLVTPAGTQWLFSITIAPGIPPPGGFGPQSCVATVTITGASQDISASFTCPLLARPVIPSGVGSPGQTITNSGGVLAGTPCQTLPNNTTGPVNVGCDWHSGGPNPYVDITTCTPGKLFCARAVNPNTTPAAVGLTANCTNGQVQVPISSASTFQNNDGVILYGCGAPHSMTTPGAPTVTPVLALNGTHTLITTGTAPTGATTYNYYIMARDRNGGLTALSTVGSTATGAASLGVQTVNITSMTRSGQLVTVTTAANHGFLVGCDGRVSQNCGEVFVSRANSLSDVSYSGWFDVISAANATTFTYVASPDTAMGASASSTGGQAVFENANKVTWSAVTPANSAVYYGLYSDRAVAGTCALIGVSNALSATGTQDLEYDDFGSPMEDNQAFPAIFPTSFPCASPPAATSDSLSTTIAGGAGTTTLTLANQVGTTVTGATIRFDDAPNILAAAATIANKQGALTIPCDNSGNQFVINSWLQLNGNNYGVSHCGPLYLNDTIEMTGTASAGTRWVGQYKAFPSAFGNAVSLAHWSNFPQITVNGAHPGLFFSGNQEGLHTEGINFLSVPVNGTMDYLVEGGFNQTHEWINFSSGTTANDFTSQGAQFRGNPGQANSNLTLDYVGFAPGGGGDGASHTPTVLCRNCGNVTLTHTYSFHRGMNFASNAAQIIQVGTQGFGYMNGGGTPFITAGGQAILVFGTVTLDTVAMPCASFLTVPGSTFLPFVIFLGSPCTPSSSIPAISGGLTGSGGVTTTPFIAGQMSAGGIDQTFRNAYGNQYGTAFDGVLYPGVGGNYPSTTYNAALSTGNLFPIFVQWQPVNPTSCAVSAGGSITVATHSWSIAPVGWNGGEGRASTVPCSSTTSGGNQTVTLNYPAFPGPPQLIRIFDGNTRITTTAPGNSTSVVLTTNTSSGNTKASVPSSGPTMLMPNGLGFTAPQVVLPGPPSGTVGVNDIGYDTTTGTEQHNSNNNGASSFTGAWNATNVTPVTVNANVTTDQNMMAVTLPAGTLNRVRRTLRVYASGVYSTPAASVSQMTFKVLLCTVSGCGSGTVITPISIQSTALGAIQTTNDNWSGSNYLTTQTAGASSAYEAHGDFLIDLTNVTTGADSQFGDTNTATVGTIDSTAQLFLQCTFAFSTASASNSATQRQLVVETVN